MLADTYWINEGATSRWFHAQYNQATPNDIMGIGAVIYNGFNAYSEMNGYIENMLIWTNTTIGTNASALFDSQKSDYGYLN